MSTGKTNSYSDIGIDGSYQFMGDGDNIYTLNARYTNETSIWPRRDFWVPPRSGETLDDLGSMRPITGRT